MHATHSLASLILMFGMAASAAGQILPPVPPAAPATPPYTPPPPPPPVPAPPPRPDPKPADEAPLPTLIERDANGRLKRYETSLEDAALARMEFTAEQKARMESVLAARRKEIDRLVVEKLDAVLEARKSQAEIDRLRDLNALMKVKDTIVAIAPEKAIDRLLREGAITPIMKARVDQVVRAYNEALTTERQAESGSDFLKIAQYVAGDAFRNGTREVFASLDAMLVEAARRIEGLGEGLGLTGEAAAALAKLKSETRSLKSSDEGGLKRLTELTRAFFFEKLDLPAQRSLLEQVAPK